MRNQQTGLGWGWLLGEIVSAAIIIAVIVFVTLAVSGQCAHADPVEPERPADNVIELPQYRPPTPMPSFVAALPSRKPRIVKPFEHPPRPIHPAPPPPCVVPEPGTLALLLIGLVGLAISGCASTMHVSQEAWPENQGKALTCDVIGEMNTGTEVLCSRAGIVIRRNSATPAITGAVEAAVKTFMHGGF